MEKEVNRRKIRLELRKGRRGAFLVDIRQGPEV